MPEMSSVLATSGPLPAAVGSLEGAIDKIDPPMRDALNDWLSERGAPRFRLDAADLGLTWKEDVSASWRVAIELGAATHRAILALDGFAALDPLLVGEPFDLMPAALRDLAIHRLAARILTHAPPALVNTLEVRAIHWEPRSLPAGGCRLPFVLHRWPEGTPLAGCLVFESAAALKWLHAVLPIDSGSRQTKLSIPMPLRLLLGRSLIAERSLQELEVGDVVLVESAGIARQGIAIELCAVTGGATWRCRAQRDSLRVVTTDEGGIDTASGFLHSLQGASAPQSAAGVATMSTQPSQFEVPVTFDLGELHLKVADLQQLQPGHVIELQQDIATTTVALRVASRRIAEGSLITIGKRLGVRISRILAQHEPGAA